MGPFFNASLKKKKILNFCHYVWQVQYIALDSEPFMPPGWYTLFMVIELQPVVHSAQHFESEGHSRCNSLLLFILRYNTCFLFSGSKNISTWWNDSMYIILGDRDLAKCYSLNLQHMDEQWMCYDNLDGVQHGFQQSQSAPQKGFKLWSKTHLNSRRHIALALKHDK